ncbi:hypothetical protein OH77DRAFT_1298467 [Trametes cingulata]|nr:hypothetical protein OH77DRAFT_1298467 [Trametes cingulata]
MPSAGRPHLCSDRNVLRAVQRTSHSLRFTKEPHRTLNRTRIVASFATDPDPQARQSGLLATNAPDRRTRETAGVYPHQAVGGHRGCARATTCCRTTPRALERPTDTDVWPSYAEVTRPVPGREASFTRRNGANAPLRLTILRPPRHSNDAVERAAGILRAAYAVVS